MEIIDKGTTGWKLLPPAKDCCPECAVKHKPDQPHNPESLYYQMKLMMRGFSPIS